MKLTGLFIACTKGSVITGSVQTEQKNVLFTLMNSCAKDQFLPFIVNYLIN